VTRKDWAVRDTIIDGKTGLMAEPESSTDLADKIAILLDDEALCADLASEGRRYALGKFTWTAVGLSYTNIIAGLIDNARTVHR
jgi:N,N'-diacetylbacillosaminyl-diphospho-undecaprenol alpha-1,3-N-acetylgalactosaminyltransferase